MDVDLLPEIADKYNVVTNTATSLHLPTLILFNQDEKVCGRLPGTGGIAELTWNHSKVRSSSHFLTVGWGGVKESVIRAFDLDDKLVK